MVSSENWKRLDENFRKRLFPRFSNKKSLPVFNILKEPLLVQKQTIHQQKALDFSFNLTPWKWAWHDQEGTTPPCREKHRWARRAFDFFYGRRAWQPHDNATPTFRVPNISWDQGLSAEVSFVSVLSMALSEYWKRLEENFRKRLFPRFPINNEIYKKKIL